MSDGVSLSEASNAPEPAAGSAGDRRSERVSGQGRSAERLPGSGRSAERAPGQGRSGGGHSGERSRGGARFLLLWLLLLGSLAVSGYLAYRQQGQEALAASLADALEELRSAAAVRGAQLEAFRERLDLLAMRVEHLNATAAEAEADDSARRQTERRLTEDIESLRRQVGELRATGGQSAPVIEPRWGLGEAQYFVLAARQRLQLADVATALMLLENADTLLREADDEAAFAARAALMEEMGQLRALGEVDLDGIYLRLTAVLATIDELDMLTALRGGIGLPQRDGIAESPTSGETDAGVGGPWARTLEFLRSVFVLRQPAEVPREAFALSQPVQYKQGLRLLVQQARAAVYSRDAELYQLSLAQLQLELEPLGTPSDPRLNALRAEIQALAAIDIDPLLPSLNNVSALLAQGLAAAN